MSPARSAALSPTYAADVSTGDPVNWRALGGTLSIQRVHDLIGDNVAAEDTRLDDPAALLDLAAASLTAVAYATERATDPDQVLPPHVAVPDLSAALARVEDLVARIRQAQTAHA